MLRPQKEWRFWLFFKHAHSNFHLRERFVFPRSADGRKHKRIARNLRWGLRVRPATDHTEIYDNRNEKSDGRLRLVQRINACSRAGVRPFANMQSPVIY